MQQIVEMQIEEIPILTNSILETFKKRGFTISNERFDVLSGQKYFLIYSFGNIVKKLIFQSDERKN